MPRRNLVDLLDNLNFDAEPNDTEELDDVKDLIEDVDIEIEEIDLEFPETLELWGNDDDDD